MSACLMFIAHYVLLCLVMSGKKCVTIENHIDLVTHNQYLKTKLVNIAWNKN